MILDAPCICVWKPVLRKLTSVGYIFLEGKKASFILEFPLGDDAHSEAICGAGAEPEPTPPIRRELPQRDPPFPRGQQGHLLLRQQDPRGHRAQRADVSAQAQRQ